MINFSKITGFDWNKGNIDKNFQKHNITDQESESVFFDPHKKILKDTHHSKSEKRFILIGKSKQNRKIFIAFTIRKNKIRIISARLLNKKEYYLYE